jgi:hydrogenase-1 operon protein HyaF
MDNLESIPVRVEEGMDDFGRTENVGPLLRQIEQALQDLQETGSETIIDLGAMPFSDEDERDLRERLGRGEVSASVEAFGPTLIEETAFAGVWLVEYQDAEQRRLTLHLQVARIPGILMTPQDDLADSLAALRQANRDLFDAPTEIVQ